ncbi:MAG: NADH-quinone oxidoreductase subunit D, partial [Bacteroidetes bacterium]|nr:NADH-quinone oxidoreductase subunit D [Bacteroidota bacterium]
MKDIRQEKTKAAPSFFDSKETIDGDIATINFGPTHPATHGIFQNILKVDGEKILSS